MSSAGTSTNAKRTAVVHLLFNVLGCVIFIAPIWALSNEITSLFASISGDVGQQIAIFHTLFNILTTLLLLPFSKLIVKLVCKIIPEKKTNKEEFKFAYIDERMLKTPPIAVGNIRREVVRMGEMAKTNINLSMAMLLNGENSEKLIRENETKINYLNKNLTAYLVKLMSKDLSSTDEKKVGSYYHVVSDLERVGDYAENIMEYAMRLSSEQMQFSEEAKEELSKMAEKVNTLMDYAYTAFDERDVEAIKNVEDIEDSLDQMTKDLEEKHIERVKKGTCTAQLGSAYLQTISNLERVGDHVTNVACSIRKYA
jgi:phosphate:Na+ symporter